MGRGKTEHDSFTMPRRWTYRLPPSAFKLYAVLLSFTSLSGGCYASNKTVGERAAMSPRTVTRWAAELERENVLTRVERQDGQATTSWTIMHEEVPPEREGFAAYKESKLAEHESKHGPLPEVVRRAPYPPLVENGVPTPSRNRPTPQANTGEVSLVKSGSQVIPTTSSEVVGMEIDLERDEVESGETRPDPTSSEKNQPKDGQGSARVPSDPLDSAGMSSADLVFGDDPMDQLARESMDNPFDSVRALVMAAVFAYGELEHGYDLAELRGEAAEYVAHHTTEESDKITDYLWLIPLCDEHTQTRFEDIGKLGRNVASNPKAWAKTMRKADNSGSGGWHMIDYTRALRTGVMSAAQLAFEASVPKIAPMTEAERAKFRAELEQYADEEAGAADKATAQSGPAAPSSTVPAQSASGEGSLVQDQDPQLLKAAE